MSRQPNPDRLPHGTLMLLMQGADMPSRSVSRLVDWLRSGERLVVVSDGSTGSTILARLGVRIVPSGETTVRVIQPLLLAPPAATLGGMATAVAPPNESDVPVARGPQGPILTRRQIGRGILWVLSAPQLLENDTIARVDNRRLLLNLAGPRGTVVLDQQLTGAAAGPAGDWITTTVWGVAALFLLAVAVLYRWLSGWRLGPPVDALGFQHRPAGEYVVALAGLLRRARSRRRILGMYQHDLQRALAEQYGDLESERIDEGSRRRLHEMLSSPKRLSERALIDRARAIVEMEERVRTGHG